VWEIASRKLVGEVPRAHRQDVTALTFSPDGHHLATGSDDTTILLWDVRKLGVRPLPAAAETRITGAAEARLFIDTRSRDYRIQADGTLAPTKGHEKQKTPPLKSVTRLASASFAHCALAEGKVRCWGTTGGGVLGIPPQKGPTSWSFAEHPAPTTVPVKDPVDLQVDGSYACALERGGDLVCWGRLDYKAPVSAPGKVLGAVKSFDIANGKACATGTDSVVRCWTGAASPTPLTLTDTVQIAGAAQHTCALDKAGAVQCAGQNTYDQLGDDTGLDRSTFAPVPGVSGAISLVASHLGTCALVTGGGVVCWGQIGTTALARPTRLSALDGSTAVRIDGDAVCGMIGDRIACVDLKIRE
jgi:alpha-tubulin suppressor-like RCC1 family protein